MIEEKRNFFLKKRIGVIGGSLPDPESLKNAEKMGKLIAKNEYILVNGGLKGVMEASAKGAKSENGLVLGILPGNSTEDANGFVDIAIPTGLGYMRNAMIILNSDILIAIDGSYGTLSEISYANIYNKKVFGLQTWKIDGVIPFDSPEEIIANINLYFGK